MLISPRTRLLSQSAEDFSASPRALICIRSFFHTPKKSAKRVIAATVVAVLTLSVGGLLLGTHRAYAVYVNGAEIGAASTRAEAEAVVKSAEEQLSEIFGEAYALEDVAVQLSVATAPAPAAELTNAIVGTVPGVSELYVIEANGAPLGAAEDMAALEALLDELLQSYTGDATVTASFLDDVATARRFVGDGVAREPDTIRVMLRDLVTVSHTEAESYIAELPFETVTVEDPTLYEGSTQIVTAGGAGTKIITENVVYYNDIEQSRAVISSSVITPPTTEIVAVGTNPRPAYASFGTYIWPTDGTVSSGFGHRSGGIGSTNHQGIDILGSLGQSVAAADGGEVIFAGWSNGFGYLVKLAHDNGDITYYAHNTRLVVSVGDKVAQGQELAKMGATGTASAVHCHFELHPGGDAAVDPMGYLPNK